MHISLDSALGRQRRLNQVGESITQIAPDPAAAYSLRSLTGGDTKVVRVRRGSDNHEQDFTASEVSSGALVDFVNAPVTAPLDIQALSATGRDGDFLIAKAAYSLRSLGTRQATLAATGDTVARANGKFVAQVRRNIDGNLKSFTATEVTDGTLVSFVNESFTSSLPLDVQGSAAAAYSLRNLSSSYSGNVVDVRRFTDGATNSYTADEITGGTLTSFANESVKYFDSTGNTNANGHVTTNGIQFNLVNPSSLSLSYSTTGGFNNTEKYAFTGKGNTGAFGSNFYFNNSFNNTIIGASSPSKTVTIEAYVKRTSGSSSDNLYFRPYATASNAANRVIVTGLVQDEWTFVTGTLTKDSAMDLKHQIQIGGDTGVTFEISNIKFFSENNDVTVSKWYDQSGNSNNAVQATAASQPKIVSAGSLVTVGVDFTDGKSMDFTSISAKTVVAVNQLTSASGFNYLIGKSSADDGVRTSSGNGLFSGADTSSSNTDDFNGAGGTTHMNGSQSSFLATSKNVYFGTATSGFALTSLSTAFAPGGTSRAWKGKIAEVIIYDTDQSNKRRAIEESIATNYGITLASFDRDGFVKTWYDQSVTTQAGDTATGNHATQATAAEQPKIVSAGALLTAGVTFDGGDSLSVSGDPVITASSSGVYSTFSVQTIATSEEGYLYGNASTSNGSSLYATTSTFAATNKTSTLDNIPRSSGQNLLSAVYNNGDAGLLVNGAGTMTDTGTYNFSAGTSNFVIGNRNGGSADATFLTGSINEIIVYNSNQSDNRTAIEANIGEAYSIDLPSGVDPGFDQVDGFVETWYDQSGNGNDLTQATAGNQPTIVSAGVLNTRNNKPIVKFIQANSTFLQIANSSMFPTGSNIAVTIFQAMHIDTSTGSRIGVFGNNGGGNNAQVNTYRFGSGTSRRVTVKFGDASSTQVEVLGGFYTNDSDSVLTYQFAVNGGTASLQAFNNGSSLSSNSASTTDQSYSPVSDSIVLGARSNADNFSDSEFFEIIAYGSDQLSNRSAIETNINNQYSIF